MIQAPIGVEWCTRSPRTTQQVWQRRDAMDFDSDGSNLGSENCASARWYSWLRAGVGRSVPGPIIQTNAHKSHITI